MNKAQTYVDEINRTLQEKGDSITPEEKEQLTKLRDEAQGALQSNNIDKLREIVGRLEEAAMKASQMGANPNAGAQNTNPNPNPGNNNNQNGDDVIDADFTDKKA